MRHLFLTLLFLFAGCIFAPSISHAQVWQESSSWNDEWENEYARWVEANWTVDFFSRKTLPSGEVNKYYGLHLDCADTVYSMRIIFAAEHGLPFAMRDPTSNSGIVTNRMTRWNSSRTAADRLRGFLRFVYDLGSTHSLPGDTFPVPISRQFIHGGALIRTTEKNHHSWTLKRMLPIGVPHLIFNSTVNAQSILTLQQRISWPNPDWVFEENFTPAGNAGFRYWRPAAYLLAPAWQVPNYSEEQFRIPLRQWEQVVQSKLAVSNESDDDKISRLFQTACEATKTRVESVNDGLNVLRTLGGACMDYANYDNLSTPSRDHRLFDDMASLRRSYKAIMTKNGGAQLSPAMRSEMAHMFPAPNQSALSETQAMTPSASGNSSCVITYAPGKSIDLAEAKRRMFLGRISNNPNDDVSYRWGELPGPSPKARSCQSWGVWIPDVRQAN